MYFEPFVEDNGNIRLEQSSLEVGDLQLPPETVLKLLRDSIELPKWIIVKPKDKEVLIQLASIPMASGVHVRAKELNLVEDIITLEIVIPNRIWGENDGKSNICWWLFLVHGKTFRYL